MQSIINDQQRYQYMTQIGNFHKTMYQVTFTVFIQNLTSYNLSNILDMNKFKEIILNYSPFSPQIDQFVSSNAKNQKPSVIKFFKETFSEHFKHGQSQKIFNQFLRKYLQSKNNKSQPSKIVIHYQKNEDPSAFHANYKPASSVRSQSMISEVRSISNASSFNFQNIQWQPMQNYESFVQIQVQQPVDIPQNHENNRQVSQVLEADIEQDEQIQRRQNLLKKRKIIKKEKWTEKLKNIFNFKTIIPLKQDKKVENIKKVATFVLPLALALLLPQTPFGKYSTLISLVAAGGAALLTKD